MDQHTQTVEDLMRERPDTRETLAQLGINHCCGAHLTLPEAAAAAGVPLATLVEALAPRAIRLDVRGLEPPQPMIRVLQEAERLDPGNPRIQSNLAVAWEASGKFDKALEAYQKALKLAPNDKEIRTNYARFVEFYQGFKGEKTATSKPDAPKTPMPSPTPPPSSDPCEASPPGDTPPPPADVRPPV